MALRRVLGAALLSTVFGLPVAAQVAPNRATAYLHPTNASDARAVWVNPAGLGVLREASVYAELAVNDPGAAGRLRQVNAGFNARGLSFGYQRDVFDGGARAHTYRVGLAGGSGNLAAGLAIARYRGTNTTPATGWDLGVVYAWRPALVVGGVIADIGQPSIRGVEKRVTFVPGFTWRPGASGESAAGAAFEFSAHARATTDSVASYSFGAAWRSRGQGRFPLAALIRLDTDGQLRRGAFALGVSIGGPDRVGVVASTPGDASRLETLSLYGVSSRQPTGRHR